MEGSEVTLNEIANRINELAASVSQSAANSGSISNSDFASLLDAVNALVTVSTTELTALSALFGISLIGIFILAVK